MPLNVCLSSDFPLFVTSPSQWLCHRILMEQVYCGSDLHAAPLLKTTNSTSPPPPPLILLATLAYHAIQEHAKKLTIIPSGTTQFYIGPPFGRVFLWFDLRKRLLIFRFLLIIAYHRFDCGNAYRFRFQRFFINDRKSHKSSSYTWGLLTLFFLTYH